MEPVTMIVMALAAGAAAGLKPTAENVILDAYSALKKLIQERYTQAKLSVDIIEQDPKEESNRVSAQALLEKTDAAQDEDVLRQAQTVLNAVSEHAPETAAAIGVDLKDIKGASLKIEDVIATGAGVRVKDAKITGRIKIKGIRAGSKGHEPSTE